MTFKQVRPRFGRLIVALALTGCSHPSPDVLTQRNDNARTSTQLAETQLTPSNVNPAQFGFLYSLQFAGHPDAAEETIAAQPLFMSGVSVEGRTTDVLYVASRGGWIYAFDVGTAPAKTDRLLWSVQLKDSDGRTATELPGMTRRFPGDARIPCLQTSGLVGVANTPVIDREKNTLYVTFRTASTPEHDADHADLYKGSDPLDARQFLGKLDLRTRELKFTEIIAPNDNFNANKLINRTALLLDNGVVYAGFGGAVCDDGGGCDSANPTCIPMHGWLMAFDANTLAALGAINTTPHSKYGGVWQSGNGLAADAQGNVYAMTGNNGSSDAFDSATEMSNAFIRWKLNRAESIQSPDHYSVPNGVRLDQGDTDLGSGGPVVARSGAVIGGGKQGMVYLMKNAADHSSPWSPQQSFVAFDHSWHPGITPCDFDRAQALGPNIHQSLALWYPEGVAYGLMYGMPEKDYLKSFRVFDNSIEERPYRSTIEAGIRSARGMPGGFVSVSADGGRNGIVWVLAAAQSEKDAINTSGDTAGRLMAFDALTLQKLWESEPAPFAKSVAPTIAGGKVYRATYKGEIRVYGLSATPNGTGGAPTPKSEARTITALWRDPGHLDLFMTSRDASSGNILSTSWEGECAPQLRRGWRGWFPIESLMDNTSDNDAWPPSLDFSSSANAPVTAVWRDDRMHLDLFVVGTDGHVMSITWDAPTPPLPPLPAPDKLTPANFKSYWSGWFEVRSPEGRERPMLAPGQPIAAVWRPKKFAAEPRHLDLFTIDKSGVVWSTFHDETVSEWAEWFPVTSSVGRTPKGARDRATPVTALWRQARAPDERRHLDLFMVDSAGLVQSTFFDEAAAPPAPGGPLPKWADWFVIPNPNGGSFHGSLSRATTITAVWRPSVGTNDPRHLDLFATDKDGIAWNTFLDEQASPPGWAPWGVLKSRENDPPPNLVPGQAITAVWRDNVNRTDPLHLDLFVTSAQGRIESTYFDESDPGWRNWFVLTAPSGVSPPLAVPGQEVTALWSKPGHLDLFITAQDGRVMTTFFDKGWRNDGWFPL